MGKTITNATPLVQYLLDLNARKLLAGSFPGRILEDKNHFTALSSLPSVLYAGFDPTAKSLHIGNLLVINNLLRSTKFGCKALMLVGEATASVGDPSGRAKERPMADQNITRDQAGFISTTLSKIADNCMVLSKSPGSISLHNNAEWLTKMNAIDFLRKCKPFRVGAMLRTGAVKSRMEGEIDNDGISFTEFSYQTLQSIDWLHLTERHDCFFQIGGSDQLGHLDLGAHYIRKQTGKFAAGITLPLITDASGNKLGKSTGASVWLSDQMTTAFHFYQFWKQLPDVDAERLLPMFTLKSMPEAEVVLKEHKEKLGKWIAQEALANEMTMLVHGQEGLDKALACSRALFQNSTSDLHSLTQNEILALFGESLKIQKERAKTIGEFAAQTRNDGKPTENLVKSGAFKVNGVRRGDPEEKIDHGSLILGKTKNLTLICWGKRKFQLIEWT
ncbi:unnamed protein product, partial [Mesorhabditis belari]|uniref:Tyrosine--tRNA ligase n=1 Tax=Mesorhabditis belari TaxID=2138241 RepID=A0AAF3FBN1_9BILA